LGLLLLMEYSCCSINLWVLMIDGILFFFTESALWVLMIDGIFWGWWNILFFKFFFSIINLPFGSWPVLAGYFFFEITAG
jgi:hypothetical protein